MSEIPAGWTNCNLEDCTEILDSMRKPVNNEERQVRISGKSENQLFPYYGATGQVGLIDGYLFDGEYVALGEDGVPFFDPQKHKAYLLKGKTWVNNHAHVLRGEADIDNRFLCYQLNHTDYHGYVNGATRLKLTQQNMRRLPILLPPLNEQIRIADKLDSVLAKVDAAQARLEKIPTLLKRFRQSVLAAATSGELTREWSETNGMRLDQWSWKKLSDIAEIQGGVTKDSKKQSDEDEEIPYLRVANVQRGYLDLAEIKTIRIPSSKLEKLLLQAGDVLFNEGGDLDKLGRGWVWENQISRCSFQNHVFRARLYDSNNSSKYTSWWGNTRGYEYFIRQGKQTTNLASINKTILSNLPINMPPAEEQKEIVRRVESLFALADTVEKQYLETKKRIDRLTQSLLAKAFRGELVPQDPKDEPAAELLKRIQSERHAQPPVKIKRTKSA